MKNFRKNDITFIDPMSDFGFKKLFAEEKNKDNLIYLLQVVLGTSIRDLRYLNVEVQPEADEEHGVVYDVQCTLGDGKTVIVEMQVRMQRHIMDRALFYSTFPLHRQRDAYLERRRSAGEEEPRWDYDLSPVAVVAFLNFPLPLPEGEPGNDGPLYRFELRESGSGALMTDRLRFYFVELYDFDKSSEELRDGLDRLMYVLKKMKKDKKMPEVFAGGPEERIYASARHHALSSEEQLKYDENMLHNDDYYNTIDYARAEGLAEGLARGREEGVAEGLARGREEGLSEGKINIARNLLAMGISPEKIAEATGLTVSQLKELQAPGKFA